MLLQERRKGTTARMPAPTALVITHGHFDHFTDCIPLAKRTGRIGRWFTIRGWLTNR